MFTLEGLDKYDFGIVIGYGKYRIAVHWKDRYEEVVEGDALAGVRASVRAKGVPPASKHTMQVAMSPAGAKRGRD